MKDNNKTPKEHNPFNVFPDDVSVEDMKRTKNDRAGIEEEDC